MSPRRNRSSQRGLTLIEIIIAMVLVAIITAAVVTGTNQLPGHRLKRSATLISSAIKTAYTRASATSRPIRLVMDLDEGKIWLEEGSAPLVVQSRDKTGTGGADPMTDAEKAAVAEGEAILKGPRAPRPAFKPIDALGFGDESEGEVKGARSLQRNIKFRQVQTAHDEEPRTSGRAYLYFWPGGQTERAAIQIRIGTSDTESDTMTISVAPLTGKVTLRNAPVPLAQPVDDRSASEREDNR